uniref:Uncharacterized protein n=1 Tax=Takifugu rubripes TaxID=31033 RepID=A0A674NH94_TAKRU
MRLRKTCAARTLRNRVTQFTEEHRTVTVGNNVKWRGSNCLSPPPPAFNSCSDKHVNRFKYL